MNQEDAIDEITFLDNGHVYHASIGKLLVLDGSEINELVTGITDTGWTYRIIGANRQGLIMEIKHDQLV